MNIHTIQSVYQSTQCIFTTANIEASSSQAKRRPATNFRSKGFIHRVDIISPDSGSAALEQVVQRSPVQYYKAKATLGQLFDKEFFVEHVKTGNISMLSEGNPVAGNTFSLCRGKLKLHLDRETYERSGLSGKLDERNGSREMRSKWLVTYDLQSPSMQHGKRGFDRLVYGCKSISETPLKWLCTLEDPSDKPTTLDQISYAKVTPQPVISEQIKTDQVISPSTPCLHEIGLEGPDAADLYEWLSLVRLGSPRVLCNDSIDPYLSRYNAPDCPPGEMSVGRISWSGLLNSAWVSNLVSGLMAACPEESWVAISATDMATGGLGGKSEITVLKPPGQSSRYFMWDIKHN